MAAKVGLSHTLQSATWWGLSTHVPRKGDLGRVLPILHPMLIQRLEPHDDVSEPVLEMEVAIPIPISNEWARPQQTALIFHCNNHLIAETIVISLDRPMQSLS